jgi:prephenate dehydrogenase
MDLQFPHSDNHWCVCSNHHPQIFSSSGPFSDKLRDTHNHLIQVLVQHRAPDWALHMVEDVLRSLGSRYVYLSYEEHDRVTANVQAVTHAAFLRHGAIILCR